MEKYEILYILPAKHTEEELRALSNNIKEVVVSHGGEVNEEHHMGKRKLAYPISHVRHGHYYLIIFSAEQEIIDKLNATLLLMTELLRHLIIKRDPYIMGVPKLQEEYSIVRKDRERDHVPHRRPTSERKSELKTVGKDEKKDEKPGNGPSADEKRDKITIEDLDKKLDKILTDDIL